MRLIAAVILLLLVQLGATPAHATTEPPPTAAATTAGKAAAVDDTCSAFPRYISMYRGYVTYEFRMTCARSFARLRISPIISRNGGGTTYYKAKNCYDKSVCSKTVKYKLKRGKNTYWFIFDANYLATHATMGHDETTIPCGGNGGMVCRRVKRTYRWNP